MTTPGADEPRATVSDVAKSSDKQKPWAGKSGPGYAFDDDGELLHFASASSMSPKPQPPKK